MTEGRKAGWASKIELCPLLSSKSGTATGTYSNVCVIDEFECSIVVQLIKKAVLKQRKICEKDVKATIRAVGFSYAKRERNQCEQPSAFPSSMRELVTPHVIYLMSISLVNFLWNIAGFRCQAGVRISRVY